MLCLIFIKLNQNHNRICEHQTFQQIYLRFWREFVLPKIKKMCMLLRLWNRLTAVCLSASSLCGWNVDACALIIPLLTQRDFSYELDDYNKCKYKVQTAPKSWQHVIWLLFALILYSIGVFRFYKLSLQWKCVMFQFVPYHGSKINESIVKLNRFVLAQTNLFAFNAAQIQTKSIWCLHYKRHFRKKYFLRRE